MLRLGGGEVALVGRSSRLSKDVVSRLSGNNVLLTEEKETPRAQANSPLALTCPPICADGVPTSAF